MEEAPFSQVIGSNLAAVRGRIDAAARTAGRPEDAVTLVAVSKTHPIDAVRAALRAGQRIFGENRVQEALGKFPALRREFPDLTLHLIGPVQTNKVKDAVALCDVIETVDRPRLAEALAREMDKTGRRLPCFIEVNTGEEEIARRNGLDQLSMGMSADFETAIRFGATHVRVGTAIFGARRMVSEAAAAG